MVNVHTDMAQVSQCCFPARSMRSQQLDGEIALLCSPSSDSSCMLLTTTKHSCVMHLMFTDQIRLAKCSGEKVAGP